jgi:hypothetical protein
LEIRRRMLHSISKSACFGESGQSPRNWLSASDLSKPIFDGASRNGETGGE